MGFASSWRAVFLAAEARITQAAVAVGMCGLALACLVGFYQVLTRFVLHAPSSWSEPLIQTTLIWMVYVALAGAMRAGTLISVDLLVSVSTGRLRRLLGVVINSSVLGLLAILFWFGCELVWRVRFQTIAGLGMSASWAYAALPTGSLLSALALLARTLDPEQQRDHRDHHIENAA
jgi:TRAP-type C4-dicarboxylate transport system permease small subunit